MKSDRRSCGHRTVQQLICSRCLFLGHRLPPALILTSCWMSVSFSRPKVINHQGSAAVKHQRIYDCSRQNFSPMSIMQQLDRQCTIKLESLAILLLFLSFFLCGASDGSRKIKSVSIKSPQNCFNLADHQECFI